VRFGATTAMGRSRSCYSTSPAGQVRSQPRRPQETEKGFLARPSHAFTPATRRAPPRAACASFGLPCVAASRGAAGSGLGLVAAGRPAGAAPPVRKGLGRAVWCRQEAWRAARVVGGGGRGPRGWWSTSLRRRPSRRAEPTNYCGPPAGSGHAVPVAGAPKSKPTARQPDGRAASVDRRTNGGGPTPARSHPGRGSLFSVCDELTLSTVV
jgi:hypothetical protein